jgi:hypothetical protein
MSPPSIIERLTAIGAHSNEEQENYQFINSARLIIVNWTEHDYIDVTGEVARMRKILRPRIAQHGCAACRSGLGWENLLVNDRPLAVV